jgi:hypothetical protein
MNKIYTHYNSYRPVTRMQQINLQQNLPKGLKRKYTFIGSWSTVVLAINGSRCSPGFIFSYIPQKIATTMPVKGQASANHL